MVIVIQLPPTVRLIEINSEAVIIDSLSIVQCHFSISTVTYTLKSILLQHLQSTFCNSILILQPRNYKFGFEPDNLDFIKFRR